MEDSNKPLIAVLDDHTLFLKGMTLLLLELLPEADIRSFQSMQEIMSRKNDFSKYKILISDIDLPGEDSFELFTYIKVHHPSLPILIISMHKKLAVIRKAKELNIEGYILKNEDDQFKKAVVSIMEGRVYYSPDVDCYYRKSNSFSESLSQREEDILKLITNGYLNKDIAETLHIGVETVKTHKKNIKLKLGLDTTQQIIDYTKKNYLV